MNMVVLILMLVVILLVIIFLLGRRGKRRHHHYYNTQNLYNRVVRLSTVKYGLPHAPRGPIESLTLIVRKLNAGGPVLSVQDFADVVILLCDAMFRSGLTFPEVVTAELLSEFTIQFDMLMSGFRGCRSDVIKHHIFHMLECRRGISTPEHYGFLFFIIVAAMQEQKIELGNVIRSALNRRDSLEIGFTREEVAA